MSQFDRKRLAPVAALLLSALVPLRAQSNVGSGSPAINLGSAAVTISMGSSSNPAVYGTAFTVSALVMPTTSGGPMPTGTLSFFDGTQNLGLAGLDGSGRGSLQIPIPMATPLFCTINGCPAAYAMVLSGGQHSITVQYSGDANYAALTPAIALAQQITKAPSTITLAQSSTGLVATVADSVPPAPGPYHFFAMTANGQVDGNPTGTVTFLGGSTSIGTATLSPSMSLSVTSTASIDTSNAGTSFSATYSGDGNFQASSSASPAKTASSVVLSGSPNPASPGQSVTLTAAVSPNPTNLPPTGSVNFLDGTTVLGQAPVVNGVATFVATFTVAGQHALSANYSGDANYMPSSAMGYAQSVIPPVVSGVLTLTINGASTAVFGQEIAFLAQVTGSGTVPPSGTVYFLDGTTVFGSGSLSLGSAYTVNSLPVGTHQISASWAGDANWQPARSAVQQFIVNPALTTTTVVILPLPLPVGQTAYKATVTVLKPGAGTPIGTVQFIDGATKALLATVPLNAGSAQAIVSSAPQDVMAVYSGDPNFTSSTSASVGALSISNPAGALTSTVAPEEIATIYGAALATSTATAAPPLPNSLGGASVTVTDSAGVSQLSPLYYASAGQINFVVPAGAAIGAATLAVAGASIGITISAVAPSLYNVAQIVRVGSGAAVTTETVTGPIVFGGDTLYLVLYGSGIRGRSSLANMNCKIGNQPGFQVTYAGAQSQFPGMDQVVIPLSANLQGTGTVNVVLTVDGQAANAISLTFQ